MSRIKDFKDRMIAVVDANDYFQKFEINTLDHINDGSKRTYPMIWAQLPSFVRPARARAGRQSVYTYTLIVYALNPKDSGVDDCEVLQEMDLEFMSMLDSEVETATLRVGNADISGEMFPHQHNDNALAISYTVTFNCTEVC